VNNAIARKAGLIAAFGWNKGVRFYKRNKAKLAARQESALAA
jgi:hypothetical protein